MQVFRLEEELERLKQELLDQKNAHAEALQQADSRQKEAEAKQRDAESLQEQAIVYFSLTFAVIDCLLPQDHQRNEKITALSNVCTATLFATACNSHLQSSFPQTSMACNQCACRYKT